MPDRAEVAGRAVPDDEAHEIRSILDHARLEAILEELARALMAPVEAQRVAGVEPRRESPPQEPCRER
jgi:hypothetical protein